MNLAGRAYVLFATIALVAMVDRAGWIDWSTVGCVAVVAMWATAGLIVVIALMAFVVGLPILLLLGLLRLMPKRPRMEPSA